MTSGLNSSLGLTCPHGGKFYVCNVAATRFLGCCASNPCGTGVCPTQDLRSSGFTADSWSAIPEQGCVLANANPALQWWTCSAAPTFMGCCVTNPCKQNSTCPQSDLGPARLTNSADAASVFFSSDGGADSTCGSSITAGAVAGIAIGSAVAALLLGGILAWMCGWMGKRKQTKAGPDMSQQPSPFGHAQSQDGGALYSREFGGSSILSVRGTVG